MLFLGNAAVMAINAPVKEENSHNKPEWCARKGDRHLWSVADEPIMTGGFGALAPLSLTRERRSLAKVGVHCRSTENGGPQLEVRRHVSTSGESANVLW